MFISIWRWGEGGGSKRAAPVQLKEFSNAKFRNILFEAVMKSDVKDVFFFFSSKLLNEAGVRFKKSSCQLLAKECALSTGKLHRRLALEQCG